MPKSKRDSLPLIRAMLAFDARVTGFLVERGAGRGGMGGYELRLETRAGDLHINVRGDAIMCRFENPVLGRQFTCGLGVDCNPHSGKWNWGFSHDARILNALPEKYFCECIDKLLAWKPNDDSPRTDG